MYKTITLAVLAATAFLIAPVSISSAFTETIQVGDGVIFVDNDGNEPNAPPVDVSVPCPQIMPEMRPALVFIESQTLEQHLYVTAFHGGAVRRQEIVAAEYIEATQLDHGIFLVTTSGELADRGVFVIDLDRGVGKRLGRSTRIDCLRSVPERGKAMLVNRRYIVGEARYLELDLTTLSLTLCRTFKMTDGDDLTATHYGVALSPDFQRVAYMAQETEPATLLEHRLMLLDLSTMEQDCLDDCVSTMISPISSMMPGPPPLDWINNEQIAYRHIPVPSPNDVNAFLDPNALCVFKRVDAATGQIIEVLQETLRLDMGYSSLRVNPLNGELIYNNQWTLDPNDGTLTSAIVPYSVVNEYRPSRTKVFLGQDLLHAADGTISSNLVSSRHLHLAWVIHVTNAVPDYTMYVKVDDIAGPIETAKGLYPTIPSGWVE